MNNTLKVILWSVATMFSGNAVSQNTLDFDGTDDRVDCGNDTSIQITGKTLTLEAWIYPTAWKTNFYDGNIINKEYNTSNYGFMLRCGAGGKLNFAIGDGTWRELTTANTVLSLNTWQHVAGTYDGAKMRLYLNGAAIDSLSVSISISNATGTPMLIGGHTTYIRYYQGQIDEVKIWNVCRSEKQLSQGMGNEICAKTPGLKAYYKFNQGKPSQNNPNVKKLTDLSGYYNHGTLLGFALVGSSSNWIKGKDFKKDATDVKDTIDVCNVYLSPSRKYTWTKTGTYYDTIPTVVMGCDSAIMINLTVRKSSSNTMNVYACNSFLSPAGQTLTKSGQYNEKIQNKAKCDSLITINLKIGGSRDTISAVACKSYKMPTGKRTYTVSGTYSDTFKGYKNCDSIFVVKLKVNVPTGSVSNVKACNATVSPLGRVYTQTGVYYDTLKNYHGCDSLITTNLTIMKSSGTLKQTVCNQVKSPSGKYTWTQTGNYSDTILNTVGCDSFIAIELKVNKNGLANDVVTACRSYTSTGRKRTWKTSGTYKDTMANYAGCDSIITINLTINNANPAVTQNVSILTAVSTVGTYQWLNCNAGMDPVNSETNRIFKVKVIGKYALMVTENNCSDTSQCYDVTTILGVRDIAIQPFSIMPNPGNGRFEVVLPQECANAAVRIRDVAGRIVFEQSFDMFKQGVIELEQHSGFYFIEIDSPSYRSVQCLLIER